MIDRMSEDCLYLNVWKPSRTTAGSRLPVLLWIHGGGFVGGAGSFPAYDGSGFASKGMVVVTINYRLGAFGYLAHPLLSAESGKGSGAYWIMDQIAALRWVHDNIGSFGGDPAQVTIAGHSAGGISVATLFATPSARSLFARGIVQSGPPKDWPRPLVDCMTPKGRARCSSSIVVPRR